MNLMYYVIYFFFEKTLSCSLCNDSCIRNVFEIFFSYNTDNIFQSVGCAPMYRYNLLIIPRETFMYRSIFVFLLYISLICMYLYVIFVCVCMKTIGLFCSYNAYFVHIMIYYFVFQDIFFVSWIFLLKCIYSPRIMVVTIVICCDTSRCWFEPRKTTLYS